LTSALLRVRSAASGWVGDVPQRCTQLECVQSDMWRLHSKCVAFGWRAKTTIGAVQHGAERS